MGGKRFGFAATCLTGALAAALSGCSVASGATGRVPQPVVAARAAEEAPVSRGFDDGWRDGVGLPGVVVSTDTLPDWTTLARDGRRFAYIRASEGNRALNGAFAEQWAGARAAGLVVGSYHLGRPDQSSGTLQGRFLASSGGGWTPDGRTLPGVLSLVADDPEDACYGLDATAMAVWVEDFVAEYSRLTGRRPAIATTDNWWSTCVGYVPEMGDLDLALRDPDDLPGPLPPAWERPTLWLSGADVEPGEVVFLGTMNELSRWSAGALR